jgi:hypothetical protein
LRRTSHARAAVIRHAPWLDPWRGIARDMDPDPDSDGERRPG